MQSCLYKRLFSYSISKSISIRVLYHANKSNAKKAVGILHHRFLKYFEEAMKGNASVNRNLDIDAGYLISEKNLTAANRHVEQCDKSIKKLTKHSLKMTQNSLASNLSLIINQIQDLENLDDQREIELRLKRIDRKSCEALNILSFDQTLLLLNKLMEIVPHKLARLDIYPNSIGRLRNMLPQGSIDSEKIVNLLFLTSLKKTAGARDVSFVVRHLPEMRELSLIEKCIVSMATFKAGVKLDRKNIQTIEDTLHANLDLLIVEPGLFVSLLKALRYGRPSLDFSLTPISKRLLEKKSRYTMSMAVPILALYAEMLKLEKNVVQRLVSDSISNMVRRMSMQSKSKSKSLLLVRIKDVDRLLWATSRLKYRLTDKELSDIHKFVKIKLNVLSNRPKVFAGMLLSLWMLGSSKCRENVEYCFREKIFEPLLNASKKDQARLNLLLECVRIEAPWIEIPYVFATEVKEPMKTCRELETVSELIKCLAAHLALSDTKIDCPVKGIRIYGISTRHRSLGWIHIDMLNNVTCLKDSRRLNGLMSLKLRLIKRLGFNSILLDNDRVIRIESMIARIEESINSKLKKKLGE